MHTYLLTFSNVKHGRCKCYSSCITISLDTLYIFILGQWCHDATSAPILCERVQRSVKALRTKAHGGSKMFSFSHFYPVLGVDNCNVMFQFWHFSILSLLPYASINISLTITYFIASPKMLQQIFYPPSFHNVKHPARRQDFALIDFLYLAYYVPHNLWSGIFLTFGMIEKENGTLKEVCGVNGEYIPRMFL